MNSLVIKNMKLKVCTVDVVDLILISRMMLIHSCSSAVSNMFPILICPRKSTFTYLCWTKGFKLSQLFQLYLENKNNIGRNLYQFKKRFKMIIVTSDDNPNACYKGMCNESITTQLLEGLKEFFRPN